MGADPAHRLCPGRTRPARLDRVAVRRQRHCRCGRAAAGGGDAPALVATGGERMVREGLSESRAGAGEPVTPPRPADRVRPL